MPGSRHDSIGTINGPLLYYPPGLDPGVHVSPVLIPQHASSCRNPMKYLRKCCPGSPTRTVYLDSGTRVPVGFRVPGYPGTRWFSCPMCDPVRYTSPYDLLDVCLLKTLAAFSDTIWRVSTVGGMVRDASPGTRKSPGTGVQVPGR